MGEVHYMISEAAKRVNVETHVLRYWEDELTLSISRTEMGHRYYTDEDIQLFRCIKELKEQGMLLRELKGLVPDMLRTRAQLKLQRNTLPKELPKKLPKESLEKNSDTQTAPKELHEPVSVPVSKAVPEQKLEQVQIFIGELFQNAMLENNKLLQDSLSESVTKSIVKEIDYLLQAQERQDEERYKKLDSLIRQQQNLRKESARSGSVKKLRKLLEM